MLLKKAFRSYKEKRYQETIILLEKITAGRPREPWPYLLLCVTYLHCDRLSDAEVMLKKLREIKPEYSPLIQLELFLFLKSSPDINPVIAAYIDKLENNPKDKYLNRAVGNIRKVKDFNRFQKSARLSDYVYISKPHSNISKNIDDFYGKPETIKKTKKIRWKISYAFRIIFIIPVLCILAAAGAYYFYFTGQTIKITEKKDINEIDSINIDILQYDLIDKILKSKSPVFYYSNDDVIADFNKSKNLIKSEKYNDALLLINRISSSNANYRVKERNEFLRKFIANVEFRNYSDIPLEEVFQKPFLYRGMWIRWKGKIVNLKKKENKILFNMLVNYKKEDMFSGIIDVFSEKEYEDIKNGDIVTIEGVFINAIGNSNRLYVTADSILKN